MMTQFKQLLRDCHGGSLVRPCFRASKLPLHSTLLARVYSCSQRPSGADAPVEQRFLEVGPVLSCVHRGPLVFPQLPQLLAVHHCPGGNDARAEKKKEKVRAWKETLDVEKASRVSFFAFEDRQVASFAVTSLLDFLEPYFDLVSNRFFFQAKHLNFL